MATMSDGQTKISFFGDGLVQGFGLCPEYGMAYQLQETLHRAGKDVIVVNSGVSVDTITGGLARIDWTLSEGFDGILILLGGNDVLYGIDVQETRQTLAGILSIVTQQGIPVLLMGHEAPSNDGHDYKMTFETIFTDLRQEYGVLLFSSVFAPMKKRGDLDTVCVADFQED